MKILHTADWHIGNFMGPEANGRNLRADDTGMCINHLRDIALLRQPDIILVSGDIFHQARVWADRGLSEVRVAIQAIEALAETCPVVIMRGTPNHDGEEQFSMLQAHFIGHPRVLVKINPSVERVILQSGKVLNVACLPGFDRGVFRARFPGLSKEEENQAFTEELGKIVLGLRAQCDPNFPSVLMAHYTVPGCNTESGQTQFLAQFEPVLLPEILDAAAFDLVALGHIHRPQQVPSCQNTFYSGALNAMNFNDEGQERGFYIHELHDTPLHIPGGTPPMPTATHRFYRTPARGFQTLHLGPNEISNYLTGGFETIANAQFYEARDKIVRVLYSCTGDQNKALNRAKLERDLYENCGIFWVSEISPESVTIGTNKDELSEKTDPEKNLIHFLQENCTPDKEIGEAVELARPIISAAIAGNVTSQFSGAFVPICIEVKNYRNYVEESFDFTDISFCTINGHNGVGKSSLFMDAILDCLYEEPREGDLSGWIRADEKARSGSIAFTFSIGEHIFRVVRTRAKSGKATLNLSELVDGNWQNRSAEKLKETQETIINILGMDSLTFRSCALIMQDQYGLFLQASKEDRMTILGNILGLGIYKDMEQIARNCAADVNRQIAQNRTTINTLSQETAGADEAEAQLTQLSIEAEQTKRNLDTALLEKENTTLRLSAKREAAKQADTILGNIEVVRAKKDSLQQSMKAQERIIQEADALLVDADHIRNEAAQHRILLSEKSCLLEQKSALAAKLEPLTDCDGKVTACRVTISNLEDRRNAAAVRVRNAQAKIDQVEQFASAANEMQAAATAVVEMEQKERDYSAAQEEYSGALKEFNDAKSSFALEAQSRKNRILAYQEKAAMLKDSHCVDVDSAACRFLADAKASQNALSSLIPESTNWRKEQEAALEKLSERCQSLLERMTKTGYSPDALRLSRARVTELTAQAAEYEKVSLYRDLLAHEQEALTELEKSIVTENKRLSDLLQDVQTAKDLLCQLSDVDAQISKVTDKVAMSEVWVERANSIPVAEERKSAANRRITELQAEIDELNRQLDCYGKDYMIARQEAEGTAKLEAQLTTAGDTYTRLEQLSRDLHTKIGGIRARLEQINAHKAEIRQKQDEINNQAHIAALYETLKAAFSQDGIPHNIIRSMLPLLTSTANSILSQMTGGKMGMEFITDKVLKSNSKKEIHTLDIIIEEYGKDSLPYLSKSGGEKVKASLSAILALAEIKSSQAGIQLGMLFIDEPPFLDADGVQAYCDALETIQRRYDGLKVMAITHDYTMKARFPQSIDIEKTSAGSKVICA